MNKNDKRGKMKQLFANPAMIKIVAVILVAVIAVVGIFAVVASSSKNAESQVASVEQKTDDKAQEKQDEASQEEDAQEPAKEEAANEEAAEEVDYAAVFVVTINPKLKIYVDWDNVVVKMETMNADAETLLADFEWENKNLTDCFESLLSKAHEKGFLRDNAKVSIEVEDSKDVDTSSMIQKMENAAQAVCIEKDINIKWIADNGNVEESMDKVIEGKRTKTNTILPTNREQTETEETMADTAAQDKPQNDNESNSGSSNSGNNSGSNSGNNSGNSGSNTPVIPPVSSEYKLVWEDNFDADKLNRDDWNVELHEKGWVNQEWQEYVDSEENIYLKDGKLVLQAIETIDENGNKTYTSGRVNTQNKHDFKYGKFEAKIKVPSGMGFLPAFWMMPTDEQYYGQWPKCGEIDIMEVMGQSTDTLHGTIHYGDPHGQKQGTYIIDSSKADYAEDFHVYTCEWEPGKIAWYVDGIKFHEANDWYTKKEGFDEVAYPAPFDQPFYMILNVAVGGSWVGYPDETTQFGDNAQMQVDYVRVYQKDSYDENVEKPEKAEVPDSAIGENLLTNGDFANAESMKDGKDWEFLTANGGVGDAQVVSVNGDNVLKITTENAGTVDYSIQIVQGPIALKQGNKYKVSFDAWADEERSMKALISAPDLNYIRYWGDQTVNLTTEKQTFTYEFDMEEAGDANSRFEMTFGAMNSIATVYIDNVKVEKTDSFEVAEDVKTVLPDGNYVYNSGFDTGSDRMKYWTVDSNISDVSYLATNADGVREFKAVVPNTVSSLEDVVLKQEDTAISGGKTYLFTFDAYGAEAKTIKAVISPKTSSGAAEDFVFDVDVSTSETKYEFTFTMPENVTGSDVKFLIGAAGTTYIDNVRVQEDSNVINGDFSSGISGWELYAYTPDDVTFAIDELDNGSGTTAAALNITKSGPVDWHIQLKQPVTLEQGKKYRISFDTWSTVERKFIFAIQRNPDKKGGGEWTSYSGDINETMSTTGFKHYSKEFDMTWETDDIAELKFTLGAVGGVEINTPHTVFIDNVVLEEIGTCTEPEIPEVEAGVNMFTNSSFESGKLEPWILNIYGEGSATSEVKDNVVTVDVKNVGTTDGMIALQYKELTLETGASYVLTFDAVSTETRAIKPCFMDPDKGYAWYGGTEVELEKDVEKSVEFPFTVSAASSNSVMFQVGMGKLGDSTALSKITMSNFKLIKVEGEEPSTPDVPEVEVGTEMITNGDFADGGTGWAYGGDCNFANENAQFNIQEKTEGNPWDVQLTSAGMMLEEDTIYQLKFDITSTVNRKVTYGFADSGNGYSPCSGTETLELSADEKVSVNKDITMTTGANGTGVFQINLGFLGETIPTSKVTIDNISLVKLAKEDNPSAPEGEASTNLISDGNFDSGLGAWYFNKGADENRCNVTDGKAVLNVENLKDNVWDVQLTHSGLSLEKDATYKVTFDITSTKARTIRCTFVDEGNGYAECCDGQDVVLEDNNEVKVEKYFSMKSASTEGKGVFQVNVGNYGDNAQASTITIDNVSIVKVNEEEGNDNPNAGEDIPSNPGVPADNMITCGDFADEGNAWTVWNGYGNAEENANATVSFGNGKASFAIVNGGSNAWSTALEYKNKLTLENGSTYKLTFDVSSTKARNIKVQLYDNVANIWYGINQLSLEENKTENVEYSFTLVEDTTSNISFSIQLGDGDLCDSSMIGEHTIVFDNFSLVKVSDAPAPALMMLRRPPVDTLVEDETEETIEETTEETTSEEETTEEAISEEESSEETTTEESSEDPTQETSGEDVIVETKSEEEEEVEE